MRGSSAIVLLFAVAGCPTVDLGDTPADIGTCYPAQGEPYFEAQIWPSYIENTKKSCVAGNCHEQGSTGGGRLHFKTSPLDLAANYRIAQTEIACGSPETSAMYARPCGFDPHGGGQIFDCPGDAEAQIFLAWFR